MIARIWASRVGVGLVRRLVSPLQRQLYQVSRGRLPIVGRDRVLLMTVAGARTGLPRTTPLFYVRDGDRLVVCNVRPAGERRNPWTINLLHARAAQVQLGPTSAPYSARQATPAEVVRYWPALVRLWPAYERHFQSTGERTLFVLSPAQTQEAAIRTA